MKIRLFAFLCLMAACLGFLSLAVLPATAADESAYLVGYSKKDTNPWVDPNDHSQGILLPDENNADGIPLGGYGNAANRPALMRIDDNGNGVLDDSDGWFTTCTVLTDTSGTTLAFVTLDVVSPTPTAVATMRERIVAAIAAEGGQISENQIMISGSHNHTGPDLSTLTLARAGTKQHQYFQYFINQVVNAAKEAYKSRKNATMTKTTIDASAAVDAPLSFIRHYALDAQLLHVADGETVSTNTNPKLVSGANFGQYHTFTNWKETFALWTDSNGVVHELQADVANQQHVATADNSMDLLRFEVENSDDPIVLINWQAHPDNVGTDVVCADYISGLRYRLENNKSFGGNTNYRVGFFQGASGNLVTRSVFSKNAWYDLPFAAQNNGQSSSNSSIPFIQYGYLLAEAALSALEGNSATWSDPLTGVIKTKQLTYTADRQTYSDGLRAAANAYYTDKADGKIDNDADGAMPSVDSKKYKEFPYAYDYNGSRYVLSSASHASKIKNPPSSSAISLELNAILIGDGLAMVTAPVELSDRYNNETLDYLGDSIANDWDKLIGDTYGAPMILGYTNNHLGYIPNKAAYNYNKDAMIDGKPIFATGSYEANTSNYAEGTGEKLMDIFSELLQELATPEVVPDMPNIPATPDMPDNYCQRCGSIATWLPLELDTTATETHELTTGHYILSGNLDLSADIKVLPGNKVCLNLNGYTLRSDPSATRAITVGEKGATTESSLSIQDSQGGGKIFSPHRVFFIDAYGKVYMYGGTVESDPSTQISNDHGGCIYITRDGAEFNLYGGTIRGGNAPNHGGTIYLWSDTNNTTKAQFNIYGGTVIGGAAKYGAAISCLQSTLGLYGGTILSGELHEDGYADCINLDSYATVNLSGLFFAESIVCNGITNVTWDLQKNCDLRIPNGITYRTTLTTNANLGTVRGGSLLSSVPVKDTSNTIRYMAVSGTALQASSSNPITYQAIYNGKGYSLTSAISNYTMAQDPADITCIKLNKNITTTVNVAKTVCLDLNGYHISGVNVTNGATLYVMDSQTDDYYAPADFCLGSITAATGNIQPVPNGFGCVSQKEGNWYSGYVMLEQSSSISFHRVDFGITDTDTSPGRVGIRYGCSFFADALVSSAFTGTYGVAVSVAGDPAPEGVLASHAAVTRFNTFDVGGNTANASYISNIMKTTNSNAANKRNGETAIRGRAYLQLFADGPILYGPEQTTSLKQTMTEINNNWENITLQALKDQTCELFSTFQSVMKRWGLTAIEAGTAAIK